MSFFSVFSVFRPLAGIRFGVSLRRSISRSMLASAFWYAFLGSAGYALARNWEAVKALVADTNRALGIVALVVAVAIAFWFWRRSRRPPA